jgi:hypothetical protein
VGHRLKSLSDDSYHFSLFSSRLDERSYLHPTEGYMG